MNRHLLYLCYVFIIFFLHLEFSMVLYYLSDKKKFMKNSQFLIHFDFSDIIKLRKKLSFDGMHGEEWKKT